MKLRFGAVAAPLIVALLAGTADAELVFDVSQDGSNVVTTASGSINLTDLNSLATNIFSGATGISANLADVFTGPQAGAGVDGYSGLSGPPSFGLGGNFGSSSGTGGVIGVVGAEGYLFVPTGYVSGTSLSGTSTYDAQTIAGLGLTPGTYTWTWGIGANADSLTVNIGSVPEPGSITMAAVAVVTGLGLGFRSRRRAAKG